MGLSGNAAAVLLKPMLDGRIARYAHVRSLRIEGRRVHCELDLKGEQSPVCAWADFRMEGDELVLQNFSISREWADLLAHDIVEKSPQRWKLSFHQAGLARLIFPKGEP